MGRTKISISKDILLQLYVQENLSMCEIGRRLNCSFQTISNRLREYGISLKTSAQARMRYPKIDFNGDLAAKAYMVGFRIGDLNVISNGPNSETIIVRCHTTQSDQVEVAKSLFSPFGHVKMSRGGKHLHATAYLNSSFNFLIPKDFVSWHWIRNSPLPVAWAFIAGYTDAEGNFILNQGRARFKVDSYDGELLSWASIWLETQGIRTRFRRIASKGTMSHQGYVWKSDLWRLNVNDANSLELLIDSILPFMLHGKRIQDAQVSLQNILERKLYGKVKQYSELRNNRAHR